MAPARHCANRRRPCWQVCHLDCWEASDINDTQRRWLHPPYDVSNSLSRLPLGYKVRWRLLRLCLAVNIACSARRVAHSLALVSVPMHMTVATPMHPTLTRPQAMSVLATHHDGSVEYDTHNLYGLSECLATHDGVKEVTG